MTAPLDLDAAFADLVSGLQTPAWEPRRPRVENGEFVLIAGFPAGAVTTSRRRAKRLVHIEQASLSVWRHTIGGAVLVRVSTWTRCHRWIKFATRASFFGSAEVCEECAHALRVAGREVSLPEVDF